MSLWDFIKYPHFGIKEEDKNCGNCYNEKILKKGIDENPCNKCEGIANSPPMFWKDWRLE